VIAFGFVLLVQHFCYMGRGPHYWDMGNLTRPHVVVFMDIVTMQMSQMFVMVTVVMAISIVVAMVQK